MWFDKCPGSLDDMKVGGYTLPISRRTCIAGVLNLTPDSFSDGGEYLDRGKAVERALQLAEEGADIIDVGGESSRPGAAGVTAAEELERVIPVISALKGKLDIPISIDTSKSPVAKEALKAGACIVNDITAMEGDPDMARTAAEAGAGVILMHMKGNPSDMQDDPAYSDLFGEIITFLGRAVSKAKAAGIDPGRIIIDPGIGFGKTVNDNLSILYGLERFKSLGMPVLIGTSRKSFLGKITGRQVTQREFGTAASLSVAIMNGADLVRVHDVRDMADVVRVIDAIKGVKC
jgi:dihydropteroate synthase